MIVHFTCNCGCPCAANVVFKRVETVRCLCGQLYVVRFVLQEVGLPALYIDKVQVRKK